MPASADNLGEERAWVPVGDDFGYPTKGEKVMTPEEIAEELGRHLDNCWGEGELLNINGSVITLWTKSQCFKVEVKEMTPKRQAQADEQASRIEKELEGRG